MHPKIKRVISNFFKFKVACVLESNGKEAISSLSFFFCALFIFCKHDLICGGIFLCFSKIGGIISLNSNVLGFWSKNSISSVKR